MKILPVGAELFRVDR